MSPVLQMTGLRGIFLSLLSEMGSLFFLDGSGEGLPIFTQFVFVGGVNWEPSQFSEPEGSGALVREGLRKAVSTLPSASDIEIFLSQG